MKPTIDQLRIICIKPNNKEKARRISIYFTKLFILLNFKPNFITFLWIILGLAAGIFFIFDSILLTVIGVFLLYIHYIWDLNDGEVARYYETTSSYGRFLDHVGHILVHSYIFIILGLRTFIIFNDVNGFIFGLLAALVYSISSSIKLAAIEAGFDLNLYFNYKISNICYKSIQIFALARYPLFYTLIMIAAILNMITLFLYITIISLVLKGIIMIFLIDRK